MTWYVYFSAWTFSSSLAHRQVKKALYPLTACINLGDMCLASTPRHYVWDTVMGGVRSTNTPVQLVPRTLRGVSALQEPGQFLLSVEDHDHKWRSRNVFSTPFNLNSVVPGLCRFVFAQDGSIFLRFTLHFHSKSAFWSSDSHSELPRTGTACVANEAWLIHGQDAMLNSWTIYFNLLGIRSARNSDGKWRILNMLPAVFNRQLMTSRLLRLKVKGKCPILMIVEFAICSFSSWSDTV